MDFSSVRNQHCNGARCCNLHPPPSALQELGIYGRLRKISRCGPLSMFRWVGVELARLSLCSAMALVQHAAVVALTGFLSMRLPALCAQCPILPRSGTPLPPPTPTHRQRAAGPVARPVRAGGGGGEGEALLQVSTHLPACLPACRNV